MANEEDDRIRELEQLLRDERALRIRAEARSAEQAEKAAIWRTRAEERAARIDKLVAEPKRRRRRRTRAAQSVRSPVESPPPSTPASAVSRLAGIRVAAAVDHRVEELLSPFATESGITSRAALAETDLVVVDSSGLKRLGTGESALLEWLGWAGRQPFVVVADAAMDAADPVVAQADLVVGRDVARFATAGLSTMQLLPSFDPATDNPIGHISSRLSSVTSAARDGATMLLGEDGAIVGIETSDLSRPPQWLVAAAACGVPVATSGLSNLDPTEISRASVAARRWAYRHHTVTIRAAEIAHHAGLSVRDPHPAVTAVLVSMRPDQAASALDMLRRQTYRPLSVVVALHGAPPTAAFNKSLDRIGERLPVQMLEFSEQLTLGECLNRAIDASGGEILVKIDDDDFYGPAHIEDGVHALEYSGAGIVGKGAQFTYVETADRTVLRRHREQETYLGGSPTGATMLIRRHVWEQVGFPHRPRQVDVLFTRAARHNGSQVYAGSPWEFCYVRSASSHTWATPAETFLSGAEEAWSGFQPEQTIAPDLLTESTPS